MRYLVFLITALDNKRCYFACFIPLPLHPWDHCLKWSNSSNHVVFYVLYALCIAFVSHIHTFQCYICKAVPFYLTLFAFWYFHSVCISFPLHEVLVCWTHAVSAHIIFVINFVSCQIDSYFPMKLFLMTRILVNSPLFSVK